MKAAGRGSRVRSAPTPLKMRVAFQGELGAFSQQAIRQFFGAHAEPVPRPRFDDIFAALKSGAVDAAAVPIENTLAGSVHENYDLLMKYPFEITAETNVRVVHNLIAPPKTNFKDIRRVYSHPVALNQCVDFFAHNPQIERIPFYDTAGSVKMLMEEHLSQAAAIASELAARIYKGRILRRGIEDDQQNFTRFFLLEAAGANPRSLPAISEIAAAKLPELVHLQLDAGVVVLFVRATLDQDAALAFLCRLLGLDLGFLGRGF